MNEALHPAFSLDAMLRELGRVAAREEDAGRLLERAVVIIARAYDAELAKVLELSGDRSHLKLVAGTGWATGAIGGAIVDAGADSQAEYTMDAYAFARQQGREQFATIIVEDLKTETRFNGSTLLQDHAVVSGMSAVIPGREGAWGVLGVYTRTPRRFVEREAHVLQLAADLLASAIERCRAVDRLRASEARFRGLVELSSDWYWEQDAEHRFTFISKPPSEVIRARIDGLLGRRRWDLEGAVPVEGIWRDHRKTLDAHETIRGFEYLIRSADRPAQYFSISGEPVFDAAGRFAGYRGVAHDVTAQRQAEIALRESEARFRNLWENCADAVLIIDEHSEIHYANPAAAQLFGVEDGALDGRSLAELQPPELVEPHRAAMQRYLATGDRNVSWRALRTRARRADGREVPVEVGFNEIQMHGQRMFAGFMRDITERLNAETEMARAASDLRQLSRRLASVEEDQRRRLARELHDRVGQNLTALGINLEILRKGAGRMQAGAFEQLVRDTAELVDDTSKLIDDVTVELHPPMFDEFGLTAALRVYAEQQSKRTGMRFEVRAPQVAMRPQKAERDMQLFRIVQEAVNNVVKHARATRVEIVLSEEEGGLELSVQDNGRGVDVESEARSVNRFGRRGMRERAMSVNGHLEVTPAPDGGTIVRVRIAP